MHVVARRAGDADGEAATKGARGAAKRRTKARKATGARKESIGEETKAKILIMNAGKERVIECKAVSGRHSVNIRRYLSNQVTGGHGRFPNQTAAVLQRSDDIPLQQAKWVLYTRLCGMKPRTKQDTGEMRDNMLRQGFGDTEMDVITVSQGKSDG